MVTWWSPTTPEPVGSDIYSPDHGHQCPNAAYGANTFFGGVLTIRPIRGKLARMLPSAPDDDPGFLQLATGLIVGSIESTPDRICLVKIDNWFDAKWLGFVGKCMGALGVGNLQDLRIPPFHPHRVMGQWDLVWDESSDEYSPSEQPALHLYQTSESNFQRRAREVLGRSARLVWFSGNSLANGRGSLMVYDLREEAEEPWYVELTRGHPWQFGRCRGVSRAQLSGLGRHFNHELKESIRSVSYEGTCAEDIQNCRWS